MPRTTPLHPLHLAAHAKTVDFGGWDMPLHYGSQVDEHHAVRTDCGVFDVSHMRAVDLSGPGTRDFLRRVLANDVARLATPGKALYSCMLNEAGGVVDDLIVYLVGDDAYRLVVNAGTAEKDLAWLARWQAAEFPGVRIAPRGDLAIVAIQGPRAREKFSIACPAGAAAAARLKPFSGEAVGSMFVARTGYTGEDGLEVMLPAADAVALWPALVAAGVRPAGLGARDTLRLEAGMNLYGQDMDDETSPLDAGLAWTVETSTDRDFVGRRAMERRGQRHQFLGLVLDGGGILRAHQKVEAAGGDGELTSGTWSPTMGKSIALARLPLDAKPGDTVRVAIRDKKLEARVVKPPFVRAGKILVA